MIKKNYFFEVALFSCLICFYGLFNINSSNASSISSMRNISIPKSTFTEEEFLKRRLEIDPGVYAHRLYTKPNVGLYTKDFTNKAMIMRLPSIISEMYPDRPDLQKRYLEGLDECLINDKDAKGNWKYSYKQVNVITRFVKIKLGL